MTTISAILIFSAIFASMPEGLENVEGKDISTTDYLYYSVVTFTTLGYGDIVPVGPLAKMLSITEALSGVFLMSLLVVTLSRRIIT
ncbi:MAG TPA: two pore domain potassium channel family protein [Marine Group III euryarchaeote]|nr:two pore domain potassium channel family protein [Marine Group III euryarchaeote]